MNKTDFKLYSKDYLQKIISNSTSISEVLRNLGLKDAGENHIKLSKFLKESDFELTTLVGRKIKRFNDSGIPKKKLSENLVLNSTGNSNKLRERLIREGVKENKCECCGITEWNNKPITLQLHHVNGNHFDNRLENLLILCPNCHSQTPNYGGKNSDFDREMSEIAKKDAEIKFQTLLKREEQREKEIYQNKLKYGEISKGIINPKEKIFCQWCGKEILGKGKKYCSTECAAKASQKNTYSKEDILEKSKRSKSLCELGRFYGVTDRAIKKQLINLGILDIVKNNFQQITKEVEQYSTEGVFIKLWKDSTEIEKVLGFNRNKIQSACSGRQKTSNGYIWKYKNNDCKVPL